MKVKRNEPCPCGSGKKYKKCCLSEDEKNRIEKQEQRISEPLGENHSGKGLEEVAQDHRNGPLVPPYAAAKMLENPNKHLMKDKQLRWAIEQRLRDNWTIAKVAKMETSEIVDQLARYGVPVNHEEFVEDAQNRLSAWSISETWSAKNTHRCKGKEVDFLGLAACELWKRWIPERTSTEMIDDWMQEGYELSQNNNETEAVDIWLKTWQAIRARFTRDMTTIDAAESVFEGLQCLYNWLQDFEMSLRNAAHRNREYAPIGIEYCSEILKQFSDQNDLTQVNFREALASFLFMQGNAEAGLAALHEIVERWPENVWGYIYLADVYGHLFGDRGVAFDLSKAEEWLERGFANARDSENEENLKDRRALLHENARKHGKMNNTGTNHQGKPPGDIVQ